MALSAGVRFGPYEVLEPLGSGGMGEVYRANDTRLNRTVAVKILSSHLSDDPAARQRFEREARAVSSLTHPHICALYDVGHEDGSSILPRHDFTRRGCRTLPSTPGLPEQLGGCRQR